LNYDESCPDLNIKADNTAVVNGDILFSLDNANPKKIEQYAELALSKKKKVRGLKRLRFEIKLSVSGIFIHQDVLYFRVVLANTSKSIMILISCVFLFATRKNQSAPHRRK